MGCAASSIDKEERVQICRQRKRLMKQLLGLRGEFADSQLAYLRSLKNTGVTLRQFTESESLEIENLPYGRTLRASPPPSLPPSPPPPPPYSPDSRNVDDNLKDEVMHEEGIEINEDGGSTPPLPVPRSWEYWDPFPYSSPHEQSSKCETVEQFDEETWAETKTNFEEDDQEEEVISNTVTGKPPPAELVADNLTITSLYTKDAADMAMVPWRRKTLDGIIKELDDYFLKAWAGGKEIAVLMDIKHGDTFLPQNFKENKRKRSNSPKVFSSLSWSWSSKSLQFAQGAFGMCGSSEPCGPGAHCITLSKLYAAEQRLYKDVKEEEITKLEHEKKSMLLQKQEDENYNWIKTEKTRVCVENLGTEIRRLQHSVSETCSSILQIIEEELYPQLVALISG
ncbi:hypothetical protein Pint_11108 [Pistacia integerrima]|uniref:Uncharacterized protein n=1 Tax=Pistacia integerrima TaxID=434235 RepID=A0ACC0XHD6_9ROSI|nr:hypothetical protein Pint_11108 [Pistacia integerrima]